MTNYLYNGKEHPELPKVDGYDYAFIVSGEYSYLHLLTAPATISHGTSSQHYYLTETGNKIRYLDTTAGEWKKESATTDISPGNSFFVTSSELVWANFDVYDADGNLLLAASDPIPVTTAPAPDPLSMFLGMLVGRIINGQRAKSGYSVSGVWQFNSGTLSFKNESGNLYFAEDETHAVTFTANSVAYTSMTFRTANNAGFMWQIKYGETTVYDQYEDFYVQANATVDFGTTQQAVTEAFYNWLTANAVKQ